MNNNKVMVWFSAIVLAFVGSWVHAASVTLDPTSIEQNSDGTYTVNINVLLDAPEVAGAHPGAFCGVIDIHFDPGLMTFTEFTPTDGVNLMDPPTIGSGGALQTVTVGFTDAPDVGVIGTYTFIFDGDPSEVVSLSIADNDQFFGTFANHEPTNQAFVPEFVGTSFQVPVPAAAWLIASGLAVFASFARRRR